MHSVNGLVTPESDEASAGGAARGFKDQVTADGTNSEASSIRAQDGIEHTKRFATLRAQAGLAGWTLAVDGHRLVAGRWGQTRLLASLDAAEAFFGRIGVLS